MRGAREAGLEPDLSGLRPSSPLAEQQFLATASDEMRLVWQEAERKTLCAELGGDSSSQDRIDSALEALTGESILIGGPPCQAYSLVGRARNRAIEGYTAEQDHRHFLYREYVEILQRIKPAAFVMENVKGILSAKVKEAGIFSRIASDLAEAGYLLCPLAPDGASTFALAEAQDPYDFILRAEELGVPQARHRVIVLGIRSDIALRIERSTGRSARELLPEAFGGITQRVSAGTVLDGLPPLRSDVSRRSRTDRSWEEVVQASAASLRDSPAVRSAVPESALRDFLRVLERIIGGEPGLLGTSPNGGTAEISKDVPSELACWLRGHFGGRIFNHHARSHMESDLGRYLFSSAYACATGVSPKAPDFPDELAPNHQNWNSGKFSDRFRTQIAELPATTITSHIAKDGHYFIHPDPLQCRSLTVREAARLQTFPDDYIFFGNRTQQYSQVGNAVPPFMALRIARALDRVLQLASHAQPQNS